MALAYLIRQQCVFVYICSLIHRQPCDQYQRSRHPCYYDPFVQSDIKRKKKCEWKDGINDIISTEGHTTLLQLSP